MTNYTVPTDLKGFQKPFTTSNMIDSVLTITGVIALTTGISYTSIGAAGDSEVLLAGLALLTLGALSIAPFLVRAFLWNKHKDNRTKAVTTLQDHLKSEYNLELKSEDCFTLLTRGSIYLPRVSGAQRTLHLDYATSTFKINTTKAPVSVTTEEKLGKPDNVTVEKLVKQPAPVLPTELFNDQTEAIKVKAS